MLTDMCHRDFLICFFWFAFSLLPINFIRIDTIYVLELFWSFCWWEFAWCGYQTFGSLEGYRDQLVVWGGSLLFEFPPGAQSHHYIIYIYIFV